MRHTTAGTVALALVTITSAAVAGPKINFSADHSVAMVAPHGAAKISSTYVRKSKSATIYSNLAAAYPNGLYWSDEGSTVSGGEYTQFDAVGFTPKTSATATSIEVAVGNFGDGLDSYTLSLNADSNGSPGAALWSGPITSTTAFGTCCGVQTGTIKGGVPLTAGTAYWVEVTETKKQQKAMDDGAWNLATTDQVDAAPAAYSTGSSWMVYQTTTPPAFGVFSK